MIVRNLEQYLTSYISQLPTTLGSAEDPWLKEIAGSETNIKQLVGMISSFAIKTNAQILYELLQNADDADADRVCFAFDDEHFLVINNGKPFYTDTPKGNKRKGQLKQFLSKNNSEKYDDPGSIGKYGQGAKLIYDLLIPLEVADSEQVATTEKALQDAIITELKAPLLFSWSELNQWEVLKNWYSNTHISFTGDCNGNFPLLTKPVFSYYPAALGECRDTDSGNNRVLFSLQELQQCVQFIRQSTPQFNEFSFKEGTLLYVPLGKGHANALRQLLKDGLLETGIASSLAFLKNLKQVQINGRHIQKPDFLEAENLPDVKRDNQDCQTRLLYLKNPLTYQHQLYNFYQYFPITQTNYGLKFIINSYAYEIDSARQNIQFDRPQSQKSLKEISKGIQKYIEDLRANNKKAELVSFTKCLLATDDTHLTGQEDIRKLFFDNLLGTLANNLSTQSGYANDSAEVRIKDTKLKVEPTRLDIIDWDWLDTSLEEYYDLAKKHLGIEQISILELFNHADRGKLKEWLHSLSKTEYYQLLQEIQEKARSYSDIQNLPFIRCSDGGILTPKEILEHPTIVFLYPSIAPLASVLSLAAIVYGGEELTHTPKLHRLFPLSGVYYKRLIGKINSSSDKNFERKHLILRTLLPILEAKPLLRTELKIFENADGHKSPLVKLIRNSTGISPSGILERYSLKASEYIPELDALLMQPCEIWENLLEDWDDQVLPRFSVCYLDVVADLNRLYKIADTELGVEVLSEDYAWIRCQDGKIYPIDKVYFNPLTSRLTEPEYDDLCDFIKTCTDLQVIQYADIPLLTGIVFAELPHIENAEIIDHWTENGFPVSHTQLKVLKKIQSGSSFLSEYILQHNLNGAYTITARNKNKQYYSINQALNNYLKIQLNANIPTKYYLLPQELMVFYEDDSQLKKEDDNFAIDLINTFGAPHDFIEIIIKRSHDIQKFYLSRLDLIELSSTQSSIPELTGKVITHFCHKDWVDGFREKIRIDGKPLSYYIYNNSVYIKHTEGQPSAEFKLSLLLPEYQEQGDTVEKIKALFSKCGVKYVQLFETKAFDKEQIANKLAKETIYINTEQVCFMWAYAQSQSGHQYYIPTIIKFSKLNETEVLSNTFDKKLSFYSSYPLPPGWFNPKFSIETSDTVLLLNSEKIPETINTWLKQGKTNDKNSFLKQAGLHTDIGATPDPILTIRRNLRDNKYSEGSTLKQLTENPHFLDNTLEWTSNQDWHKNIEKDSDRYNTLQKLLSNHITRTGGNQFALYFDRSDSISILTLRTRNNTQMPAYIEERLDNDIVTIWQEALSNARNKNYALADATHNSYTNNIQAYLGTKLILSTKFAEESAEKNEWVNSYYLEWQEENAKGYHIYISTREIPFTYRLQSDMEIIYEKVHNKGNAQRLDDKDQHNIYIYPKQEDIVKFLMEKETELFSNDGNVLVKLVRRFYQPLAQPKDNDTEEQDTGNLGDIEGNNNGRTTDKVEAVPTTKNGDINVPDGMEHEMAKKLLEKIKNQELLEKLYENLEEIEKALEKEDRSTPNGLIGFIGEMLVYVYLKTQFPDVKVTYTAKDKLEYDIEFQSGVHKLFFDVKTTIKSIREGADTVPFYVKSSQLKFINNYPKEHYYIIRISLNDLGLSKWYDDNKKEWNKDTMNMIEDKIKEEVIAYFSSNTARIQNFRKHRLAFRLVSPNAEKALDKL